ncbi:MAG: hypothetical protein LUH36_02855 [Oscillospiraceae bacterium]|nr:hypothetical protein [Oscillospiraceae bacterium]
MGKPWVAVCYGLVTLIALSGCDGGELANTGEITHVITPADTELNVEASAQPEADVPLLDFSSAEYREALAARNIQLIAIEQD